MNANELKGLIDYLTGIGYRLVEFTPEIHRLNDGEGSHEVFTNPFKFSIVPEKAYSETPGRK